MLRVRTRANAHKAALRRGAESPTKLARDRQSARAGLLRNLTHPQSNERGETSTKTNMIAALTIESYLPCELESMRPIAVVTAW